VADLDYSRDTLHAFVFIEHVPDDDTPAELARRLYGLPQVRFASDAVGPYLAFAHLELDDRDDLGGLQDLISNELWNAGVHCKYCTEVGTYRVGAKRSTPDIIGLVSIVVEAGALDAVIEAFDELGVVKGASILTGDFDILAQVNGDTVDEVLGKIMRLQGVRGIVHTSTALMDGRRAQAASEKRAQAATER
jgi:hypothetical protein